MLTTKQVAARKRVDKQYRVERLCHRLDAHVFAAEKLKSGTVRAKHLKAAEEIREELRELDH